MDNTQEERWENLFGTAHGEQVNSSNLSQIIHQLVQGPNNQQEVIRRSVGARLFALIKEEQHRVCTNQVKGKAKLRAQNAINTLIRLAKSDVTNLGEVKERALLTTFFIYDEEVLYQINNLIIQLDELQNEQVNRLQAVNCFMTLKSIDTLIQKQQDTFYEELIRSIKAGDYLKSVTALLTHHCVYTENQSNNILTKAQQAANYYPDHSEDFLEVVKLRLQHPGSLKPNTIEYQTFKNNSFLNDPNIAEYKVSELMMLCALSSLAHSIGESLWDAPLKERYSDLIKHIDSLTRLIAKNYPEHYYSTLSQYYVRNPDG